MEAIGRIEIEERPIPQPKDNEVLIKVGYVGICGSDVHYFETGAIGQSNPGTVTTASPTGL